MRSTLKYDILCLRIVGVSYMKTKIIYISGNEIFDMAEIRAAFEEVRDALGLDKDTVLFGVPVDKDNAVENNITIEAPVEIDAVSETEALPEMPEIIEEPTPQQEIDTVEPVIDSNTEETIEETQPESTNNTEKIIPILSVLATKKDEATTEQATIQEEPVVEEPVVEEDSTEIEQADNTEPEIVVQSVSVVTEETIDDEIVSETVSETIIATAHTDDIDKMIDEEAPKVAIEKTLEQLLESMMPLREDHGINATVEEDDADNIVDLGNTDDSDDATLAQLASEFAESADKITAAPKPENHGKIGKLKNILPFKKVKRDDSGLMGDLFGWAGIAANDEDFSIPGFFTTNASKKQGA